MGSAILFTAARMQQIEDATVTSMSVNGAGRLIVTRKDGSTFDAGDVSTWLPGRLKVANNVGTGNDPNAFVQSGWYAGTNWANSLLGFTFGVVEVLAYDASYLVQNFWTASTIPRRLTRALVGGTWTSWKEQDFTIATDTEALTGTDPSKLITPKSLTAVINLISGVRGTITGAGGNNVVKVLLADNVTTINATVSPDAKQLFSNNVLLDRYPNGTYVVTASQPTSGFIAQPYDYINPKISWYNQSTIDAELYTVPFAYRSSHSWVSLSGMFRVVGATVVNGDILVNLPPAFRPLKNKLFTALKNTNGHITVNVAPNGDVTLISSGNLVLGSWFTLDGIQFNNNSSLVRTPIVLTNGWQPYSLTDYAPEYVADDGAGRLFLEGIVKNAAVTTGPNTGTGVFATVAANPGICDGVNGTLHKAGTIGGGWERINVGYATGAQGVSREAQSGTSPGLSIETFMPNLARYNLWTAVTFSGAGNNSYGSGWRPVREGLYGDGMYGVTGLAAISTGGLIVLLKTGYAPKYTILQQPEASQVSNGRLDVTSGKISNQDNQMFFRAGAGSYLGFEEYSWVPMQLDSALHK